MKYEPNYESVHKHPLPQWYDDAKFGIFIHWSLFSVPAFAGEQYQDISQTLKNDKEGALRNYPYAEWYLNSLRIPGSVTETYHKKHYGDRSYYSFQQDFEEQSANCKVQAWVDLMRRAGARYLVFVTKHHDGYNLWPTNHPNPFIDNYFSKRDFVGELNDCARAAGLKTGLYYSGVFDWTFKDKYPIDGYRNYLRHQDMPPQYIDYSVSQLKELIDRYQPSVLWNDIAFPYGYNLNELFSYYYNRVEDGVIDDRWTQIKVPHTDEEWIAFDREMEGKNNQWFPPLPKEKPHYDFVTAEYHEFDSVCIEKWECTRGIGRSFGFNRTESGLDYLTGKQVLDLLIRVVSKNGNLLINIGPRADGSIPFEQAKPLMEVGDWLVANGEAIYGTRPNDISECSDQNGISVYFTRKGETIYAISLAAALEETVILKGYKVPLENEIILLGTGSVAFMVKGNDTFISIPRKYEREQAYVFKMCKTTKN